VGLQITELNAVRWKELKCFSLEQWIWPHRLNFFHFNKGRYVCSFFKYEAFGNMEIDCYKPSVGYGSCHKHGELLSPYITAFGWIRLRDGWVDAIHIGLIYYEVKIVCICKGIWFS
jgi:hypothetical protein